MQARPDEPYVLRQARAADLDDVVRLNETVHNFPGVGAWTRDLFDAHPSVRPADFLIAEHWTERRVAAVLVGVRHEWRIGEARLPVIQVELVGTDPRDRGHRLTGRLLQLLDTRCRTLGVPLQIVDGIPYFYRRFGFDYALRYGGAPEVSAEFLVGVASEVRNRLTIRPAEPTDAVQLSEVDERTATAGVLTSPRDPRSWAFDIGGRRSDSLMNRRVAVLTDSSDQVTGHLVYGRRLGAQGELYVLSANCSDPDAWPLAASLMALHLVRAGNSAQNSGKQRFSAVRPLLPPDHPLPSNWGEGRRRSASDWYARTVNFSLLLRLLLPTLTERLCRDAMLWPESQLTIDTYGEHIHLHFRAGVLRDVTATPRGELTEGRPIRATIPPEAFTQLILGFRSAAELDDLWPDFVVHDHATLRFLSTAFTNLSPQIWPCL